MIFKSWNVFKAIKGKNFFRHIHINWNNNNNILTSKWEEKLLSYMNIFNFMQQKALLLYDNWLVYDPAVILDKNKPLPTQNP
jgi:hypothetical protein